MPGIYGGFALPIPEAEQVTLYQLSHDIATTDAASLATISTPKVADIAVITTTEESGSIIVHKTAYQYTGTTNGWVALNGEVDADKVILSDDIVLAGNYSQVGNLTKTQTGTATFTTKGMSVKEALEAILHQQLQPSIVAQPSLAPVEISPVGNLEVGSTLAGVEVSAANFNAGSYTFGPATGCTPTYTVKRVTDEGETTLTGVAADGSVTDTGLVLSDDTGEAYYKVTAAYTEGAVANDNLGNASNPAVKIAAGSVEAESEKITAYRKYFAGSSSNGSAVVNSAFIRGLTGSNGAFEGMAEVAVAANAKLVVIAYPATYADLTKIIDHGAMDANILSAFTKSTVNVEGANGYTAIAYKVYTYQPAVALDATTYTAEV